LPPGAAQWTGPLPILVNGQPITGVTDKPVVIQSDRGDNGNFELLVPSSGQLLHFTLNNDAAGGAWRAGAAFSLPSLGGIKNATLFQTSSIHQADLNSDLQAIVSGGPAGANPRSFLASFTLGAGDTQWKAEAFPILVDGKPIDGLTGRASCVQSELGADSINF